MRKILTGIISIGIFISILELLPVYFNIPEYILPRPAKVVSVIIKNSHILFEAVKASFIRVIIGFTLGSIAGIGIGILMGISRLFEDLVDPILSLLFPIPALAWAPILSIWFGLSEILPVLIVFICSFFPVAYSTLSGIKNVDRDYIDVAKTLGASEFQILKMVIIPLSLPSIITGLRIEAGMAWKVVFAAEMLAISNGIGALMSKSESLLDMPMILACMAILGCMCFLFEKIFIYLQKPILNQLTK